MPSSSTHALNNIDEQIETSKEEEEIERLLNNNHYDEVAFNEEGELVCLPLDKA